MRVTLAYIDAGTGSLIAQLIVGGVAGVAALVKYRWAAIRNALRRNR